MNAYSAFNQNAVSHPNQNFNVNVLSLSIISYNVAGLANKLLFNDFFKYVNNFDIFALCETFIDKTMDIFENTFINHKLLWIPATRESSHGRASGGCLYGIKKNLKMDCCFVKVFDRDLIELKMDRSRLYIIPVYINCNKWTQEFSNLYNFLLEFEKEDIMIIGDFNGRVGANQILNEEPELLREQLKEGRNARDDKIDGNGKKLIEMCESIGLTLLNGRTNSDNEGHFTFTRGTARSTIDYCFVKGNWLEHISDFRVDEQAHSDHFPISVQVNLKVHHETPTQQCLLPKLRWRQNDVEKYTANLNLATNIINENELQSIRGPDILIAAITEAARPLQTRTTSKGKEPWYDWECETARKKSFAFLRLVRRRNSNHAKAMYQDANKKYKSICIEKQRLYSQNLSTMLGTIKDSRSFWKTAKMLNRALFARGIKAESVTLAEHFEQLLNPQPNQNAMQCALPYRQDITLDRSIDFLDVIRVLRRCGTNKAPGEDRISYEFFKNATEDYLQKLALTYNFIWDTGNVPVSFRKSVILPIFKKGNPNEPSNYRGISFLNAITKIFTGILLDRLTDWINENNLLSEFQAGFRKEYSTVDNIFSLTSIARLYMDKGKKLYAFFVDFKAAFDCIDRRALFYKLSNLGVSTKMLNILQKLYEENKSAVWDGNILSNWFESTTGVKQGCLLSPLLFSIYLDDLTTFLPGGITFEGLSIKVLLYADDIVILAETPNMLQLMINKLQSYCTLWNLQLNTGKSKTMIFRNGTGRHARDECWTWQNEKLETVKEYRYLGVLITSTLSFKKHLQVKLQESKRAINCTWKNVLSKQNIAPSAKYKIFEAVVRSIMFYAAQIWGVFEFDDVEKLLRYFIKRIFRLPENTPTYMLHIETGLPPLYINTLRLHFSYIVKILNQPTHRLTNKIVLFLKDRNLQFFTEWTRLSDRHGIQLPQHNERTFSGTLQMLLVKIEESTRNSFKEQSQHSQTRSFYKLLNHDLAEKNYFDDRNTLDFISTVFKARGELINLNYLPYRNDRSPECTLCNLRCMEDIGHFIGICPILNSIRRSFWGKNTLSTNEIIHALNGENWNILYNYLKSALKYRQQIINESF